jgi:hypothetical protein
MHAYQTNIMFLANEVGSQSNLALMLGNKLSQSTINNIIHGKRRLYPYEDKYFERLWNIPTGWMRLPDLISTFWPFIVYLYKCRSTGSLCTQADALKKMEERLGQMPEHLKKFMSS